MKKNMGTTDRIIRTVIAFVAVILFLGGFLTGTAGIILLVVAIILLLTSLVSFCPAYTFLGIKTCKDQKIKDDTEK